jgi:DNA-binding transcriptional ArsR family regulator
MSFESSSDSRGPRLLDNPLVIRALAHPVRLDLYNLVGRDGPMTSSEAARDLGISQALASHHMRQLAKYGFVEPAAARNGRDRPWKVTATSATWRGAGADPQRAEAADVLEQLLAEQSVANLLDWLRRRGDEDPKWRDVTGVDANLIYLTHEELTGLHDAIQALVTPLVDRRRIGDPVSRPADAVPVELTVLTSVLRHTPSGN